MSGERQVPEWWPTGDWEPTVGEAIVVITTGRPNANYRRQLIARGLDPDAAAYPQGGLVLASEPFRAEPGGPVLVMVAWAPEWRQAAQEGRPPLVQQYPVQFVLPDQGAPTDGDPDEHEHHHEAVA